MVRLITILVFVEDIVVVVAEVGPRLQEEEGKGDQLTSVQML
jgi:hypothetical protein